MFKVEYTKDVLKELKKMDKHTATLIYAWIEKNLNQSSNPRIYGKALTANQTGKWRYRIGNYRLIANIQDEKVTILLLNVGHRKEIYNKLSQ